MLSYAGELAFWPLRQEFIADVRQNARVRAIYGHYSFGVHLLLGVRRPRYVTMLRNPAKRIVSFYLSQSRAPESRLYGIIRKGAQLRQLIEDHLAPELNNYVIRILAQDLDLIEAHLGPDWPEGVVPERMRELRNTIGTLTGLIHSPIGPYDQIFNETHLQRALRNIERHFCFIGVTDRMNESVRRLALGFGWPEPEAPPKLNASAEQYSLDDETMDTIRRYNRLEYALYERICAGFVENFATSVGEGEGSRYTEFDSRTLSSGA